jgi:ABC-type branched-subunit amino acid transport system substrate-binding protein
MKKLLLIGAAAVLAAGCTAGETETTATTASNVTVPATSPSDAVETTVAPSETEGTEAEATESTDAEASGTTVAQGTETTTVAEPTDGVDQTLTGSTRGVTDDTIRVGITYVDLGTVEQMSINHGDYAATYQALIDKINLEGGINGRQIEAVMAPISVAGEGNADAVCVQLTEDEEVFVVMGNFIGDATLCYVEGHEQAIIGGTQTEDALARAKAPWYTTDFGSDFQSDAIAVLAEAGELDGVVGVAATTGNQTLIEQSILPALEAAGIEVVELAYNDAPTSDPAAGQTQSSAIVQRFEAVGIDTILTVGNDGVAFAQALETTPYRPKLVMTNFNTMTPFVNDESGRDLSVLEGSVGAGSFGPEAAFFDDPAMAECAQTVQDAGLPWVDPADWTEGARPFVSARNACWALALFVAIAERAGENLNYGTFQAAGDSLGEMHMPGYPDPFTYGPPPSADGDPPMYVWAWDAAAGEYTLQT